MDRYEVMAGKMAPLTDGAHRKWGFTGKVETRSYERRYDTAHCEQTETTGLHPNGSDPD